MCKHKYLLYGHKIYCTHINVYCMDINIYCTHTVPTVRIYEGNFCNAKNLGYVQSFRLRVDNLLWYAKKEELRDNLCEYPELASI